MIPAYRTQNEAAPPSRQSRMHLHSSFTMRQQRRETHPDVLKQATFAPEATRPGRHTSWFQPPIHQRATGSRSLAFFPNIWFSMTNSQCLPRRPLSLLIRQEPFSSSPIAGRNVSGRFDRHAPCARSAAVRQNARPSGRGQGELYKNVQLPYRARKPAKRTPVLQGGEASQPRSGQSAIL